MGNKEDMKNGLENLLSQNKTSKKKDKRPSRMMEVQDEPKSNRPGRKSRMEQITSNEMRTSLVIDRFLYQQMCQIAVSNNLTYKDVMNAAMRNYIERYEKKHGPITVQESNISADDLI